MAMSAAVVCAFFICSCSIDGFEDAYSHVRECSFVVFLYEDESGYGRAADCAFPFEAGAGFPRKVFFFVVV